MATQQASTNRKYAEINQKYGCVLGGTACNEAVQVPLAEWVGWSQPQTQRKFQVHTKLVSEMCLLCFQGILQTL